jgi:DNA-binding beta-propeller fold protein YncE
MAYLPRSFGLFLTLTILLVTGCAGAAKTAPGPAEAGAAAPDLVWPRWPEVPRIRYLHSVASERDIAGRPGLLTRVVRFLKGEEVRSIARSHGLAVDAEDRLYVVDTFYRRVHVFDRKNGAHYLFPAVLPEGFRNPIGVVAGAQGRVYVSDSATKVIHVFSAHGKRYEGSIGGGLLERPTGLAYDGQRRLLFVADTVGSVLRVFDEATLQPLATEAEGLSGYHAPTHVALGKAGVFVTDSLNFRVRALSGDLAPVGGFGAAGDGPGYFSRPKGVAVDSMGHIYVVDALFANVQIFDREGRLLLAFGRPGTEPGEFWLPNDIFIDAQDRIYVSDTYNQRVQVFQYLHHETEPEEGGE